jgi:hypothetical protein
MTEVGSFCNKTRNLGGLKNPARMDGARVFPFDAVGNGFRRLAVDFSSNPRVPLTFFCRRFQEAALF